MRRAVGIRRGSSRPRAVAPGPLPAVRRRHRLLGARRDRQGGVRHPGVGLARRSSGEARAGVARGRSRPWLVEDAAGAARRRPGGARVAGGVVRGLAALPRIVGGGSGDSAGVRGPALGGHRVPVFSRAPRRLGARGPAARSVHRPPGAVRAARSLGLGAAQRDDDQPPPADRRRDLAAHRLAAGAPGASGGDARRSARAGGRQPALRRGVRAPALGPWRAGRGGRRGARHGSGADRRPTRHALGRPQEPAPGRVGRGQGVLGRGARGDGRSRPTRG